LNYNINPKYQWVIDKTNCFGPNNCPNGNSVIVGYDVSQTMEVKIRDTKKAGELLTLVGKQGVGNVSGLQFSIDDEDALKQVAVSKAIEDAKALDDTISDYEANGMTEDQAREDFEAGIMAQAAGRMRGAVADSKAAIGGGGGVFTGQDPVVAAQERVRRAVDAQTNILKDIRGYLAPED
jgi:hypothetical protein